MPHESSQSRQPGQRRTTRPIKPKPPAPGLVMTLRALVLRCPRCGGRGIWRSWFKMKPACPSCAQLFDRGESDDYWLGAYMFNLVAAEMAAVVVSVVVVIASWPNVPWNFVWGLSIGLALVMPILFFPFARDLWLAWDLYFRPTAPGDAGAARDVT